VIVAAGLTPAWQQILEFERFAPGEVNRARRATWCGSGKVLNVGLALAHLGAECSTVALVGGGPREAIDREFAGLKIDRRWVEARLPTRICTTLLDRSTGQTTELVENAAPVTADELAEFVRTFTSVAANAAWVILSGSLSDGAPATFYRDLLGLVPGRAVLDARGPELLAALERRPFLVKPNREELAHTLGRSLAEDGALVAGLGELIARGAQWAVVTDGRRAVWGAGGGHVYRWQPLAVETVNPIGCGDCLAAGLTVALAEGRAPPEAVAFGIAAAADNAGQLLPGRLDRERIARLRRQVQWERVAG
jgi:1-phosphofructokinase family hexose kinase